MDAPQTEAHAHHPPQKHPLPSSPLSAPPSSPSTLNQGQYQSTAPDGQSTEMVKYGEPIPMPPSRQGQAQEQALHPKEYEINIPRNLPSFPSPYQLMAPPPSPSQQHQPMPSPPVPSQNWPQQQQSPQQHQQQRYQATQSQSKEVVRYGQHPDQPQDQGYQHSTNTTAQAQTQHQEQAPAQAQTQTQAQGPTSTPKTPSRNFFAVPPSNHTPQISSSPIMGTNNNNTSTPNRPTNPQAMTASYPGASSRIKQSQSTGAGGSGIAYQLPPPTGSRVVVKRESKGPSGAFKIPWKSPGPIADVQIGQNGQGNRSTEEKKQDQIEQARPQQQEHHQRGSKEKEKEKGTELRQGQQAAQAQAQIQVSPSKESGAQRRAQAVLQAVAAEQQAAVPSPRGGLCQSQEPSTKTQMLDSQNTVPQHRARPHTVTYTESNQRQEPPRESNVGPRVSSPHHYPQQQEQQVRQNDMNQKMVPQQRQVKQERIQGQVQPQQQQSTPMPMPMPSGDQAQHPPPNNGIQYEGAPIQPRGPKSQGQPEANAPQSRENDRQYDLEASRQYHPEQPQTQAQNHQSANYSYHQAQEVDVFGPHPARPSSAQQYHQAQHQDAIQYPAGPEQGQDQARARNDHEQGHNQEYPEERTPTQSSKSKSKSKRSRESKSSPQNPNLYQQGHKRSKHEYQQGSSAPSTSSTADVGMDMEMAPPESSTQVEPEEEVSQFDAFAEIEKYDHVKELQEPWNEMMDEMVPFIDEWAEKYLSTTMDTIYGVYGCFHNMSAKNAESLKQGVKDIQAYQETQNEIRQTLVDFRMGVAQISSRLVGTPGGAAGPAVVGQPRAGTPGGNGSRK